MVLLTFWRSVSKYTEQFHGQLNTWRRTSLWKRVEKSSRGKSERFTRAGKLFQHTATSETVAGFPLPRRRLWSSTTIWNATLAKTPAKALLTCDVEREIKTQFSLPFASRFWAPVVLDLREEVETHYNHQSWVIYSKKRKKKKKVIHFRLLITLFIYFKVTIKSYKIKPAEIHYNMKLGSFSK